MNQQTFSTLRSIPCANLLISSKRCLSHSHQLNPGPCTASLFRPANKTSHQDKITTVIPHKPWRQCGKSILTSQSSPDLSPTRLPCPVVQISSFALNSLLRSCNPDPPWKNIIFFSHVTSPDPACRSPGGPETSWPPCLISVLDHVKAQKRGCLSKLFQILIIIREVLVYMDHPGSGFATRYSPRLEIMMVKELRH